MDETSEEIKFAPRICDAAVIHWPGTKAHRSVRLLPDDGIEILTFNEVDGDGNFLERRIELGPTSFVVSLEELGRSDYAQVWCSEQGLASMHEHWEAEG